MGRPVENAVLSESAILASPDSALSPKGIYRARLIEADVQGSSGFYPAEILRRDGATAFPAGTPIYLDHPTRSDEMERPERSVREMAGILLDPANYEEAPDGRGLFARVQFFEDVRDLIKSRWEHVGLSIRAAGEVEDTPEGRIVRSIREGLSVDVVTRPGAGGRLVTMTESSKPDTAPADKSTEEGQIPSTSGTGALLNEVSAMRESLSDRVEQLSIDVARMSNQLKEAQRETEKRSRESGEIREAMTFLKDRQQAADQALAEAKTVGQVVATLIEAKLPIPSLIRLAQGYHPGQDLHESIQREREYLKKVIRESERGDLTKPEPSMLGLTEAGTSEFASITSNDEDFSQVENVLSGKLF